MGGMDVYAAGISVKVARITRGGLHVCPLIIGELVTTVTETLPEEHGEVSRGHSSRPDQSTKG